MRAALTSPLDFPGLVPFGLPTAIDGTAPAAGAEFTFTIPGDHYYVLHALFVRLTPDANAADRTLAVDYRDQGGNVLLRNGAPVTFPASDTTEFSFQAWREVAEWEVNSTVLAPLAPMLLAPSWSFRIAVTNIQATDTLTRIRFVAQRYYTTKQPHVLPPGG